MRLILKSNPVRVYASAGMDVNHFYESYEGRTPDILDNAFAVLDFENGARAMLGLCLFAEGSHWQEVITATGDKARIDAKVPGHSNPNAEIKNLDSEVVISERASGKTIKEEIGLDEQVRSAGSHFGSTYYQHLKFHELVKFGNGTSEVSIEDGFWSVVIGEAATKSAKSGEAVRINI